MLSITLDEMEKLLQQEIAKLSEQEGNYFKQISVPISRKVLKWEYGNNEEFDAWVFADFKERNVGAAYCLGGFGAMGSPWGLIFLHDEYFGMDCGWYSNLKDLLNDGWL